MNTSVRAALVGLSLIIAFFVWYRLAADYGYSALSGTYTFVSNRERSTLVLKQDRTFEQKLINDGKVQLVKGNWRRIGEGGIVFSGEFLKMAGQEVRPDGEADTEVNKKFGLIISIVFDPYPGGPTFHKKLFG